MGPGAERSSRWIAALAFGLAALAGAPHHVVAQEPTAQDCGPSHRSDVQEILQLRDPGTAESDESTLRFDRALIIEDFLRLKAEEMKDLPTFARQLDAAGLRSDRDSGRASPQVCAVVRFMHAYYVNGERAPDAAALEAPRVTQVVEPKRAVPIAPEPPADAPPELAPVAASPTPVAGVRKREIAPQVRASAEPAQRSPARDSVPAASAPEGPRALAPVAVAAITQETKSGSAAKKADAELRSRAVRWMQGLERQLKVPRYLSFRETRIERRAISDEELRARQDAALAAAGRILELLARVNAEPELREAMRAALRPEDRKRIEQGIELAFKSVPDAKQRVAALAQWSEAAGTASP